MRLIPCALCVVIGLFAWNAWAHVRVALVVPDEPTGTSTHAEERLRAELMSAGYEVVTVPAHGIVDRSHLRAIATRTGSSAAVSVQLEAGELEGSVWARSEATGQESLERVRPAGATLEGAATFAIWAAEQLRASVLAFETEAPAPTASEPPKPTLIPPVGVAEPRPKPPAPNSSASSNVFPPYALSGGVAVLFGPGGVPAAFGPSVTLSWRTDVWFGAIRFLGPASCTLETTSGTVDIDQEQAIVHVGLDIGVDSRRIVPFAAIGLGAHRLGVRGDAVAPYRSTSNQAWSGMLQLTGGLRLRLSDLVFVEGEAGAWVVGTKPVVRIDGASNVHIGRPGFTGALALGLSW